MFNCVVVLLPPSSPQPCHFSYIQPSAKNKYIWVGHMTNFNSKLNFQRKRKKRKERKRNMTQSHTENRKKNKRQPRARDAERINRKKEKKNSLVRLGSACGTEVRAAPMIINHLARANRTKRHGTGCTNEISESRPQLFSCFPTLSLIMSIRIFTRVLCFLVKIHLLIKVFILVTQRSTNLTDPVGVVGSEVSSSPAMDRRVALRVAPAWLMAATMI